MQHVFEFHVIIFYSTKRHRRNVLLSSTKGSFIFSSITFFMVKSSESKDRNDTSPLMQNFTCELVYKVNYYYHVQMTVQ
jgi:hypothetical protein